jgi:hypothetical protein
MRGILTAGPAELAEFYFEFLFFAAGKMIVLVLAYGTPEYYSYSVSHSFSSK